MQAFSQIPIALDLNFATGNNSINALNLQGHEKSDHLGNSVRTGINAHIELWSYEQLSFSLGLGYLSMKNSNSIVQESNGQLKQLHIENTFLPLHIEITNHLNDLFAFQVRGSFLYELNSNHALNTVPLAKQEKAHLANVGIGTALKASKVYFLSGIEIYSPLGGNSPQISGLNFSFGIRYVFQNP